MSSDRPLVSIICLCFDQEQYVRAALQSAIDQTYKPIQIIAIDDGSADSSQAVIESFQEAYPQIEVLFNNRNEGNCVAFNRALGLAKGKYVIDLAGDDILMPNRVAAGVSLMEKLGDQYGLQYSDALMIDTEGDVVGVHITEELVNGKPPEGYVFKEVLAHYFIAAPTIMVRKTILDSMGGYDDSLAYEDFDLWVRVSRDYKFCFIPDRMVRKRVVAGSLGSRQYGYKGRQMWSTFRVCQKAQGMLRSREEEKAFRKRVGSEMRQAIRYFRLWLLMRYTVMWVIG